MSNKLKIYEIPDFGVIQLRALLGDFRNKKISVPLNVLGKNNLISSCINEIIKIHNTLCPSVKILITADSEIFLKQVSKLDFVYAISSKTLPIEYGKDERYNIFLKSYIDLLMLSEANKLFLLYTNSMYRSGFAKNASYINSKEYIEINF